MFDQTLRFQLKFSMSTEILHYVYSHMQNLAPNCDVTGYVIGEQYVQGRSSKTNAFYDSTSTKSRESCERVIFSFIFIPKEQAWVDIDTQGYIHLYIHVWTSDLGNTTDISMDFLRHLIWIVTLLILNISWFRLSFSLRKWRHIRELHGYRDGSNPR